MSLANTTTPTCLESTSLGPDHAESGAAATSDPSGVSTGIAPNRPQTRQRIHKPPPPLAVPNINEDAAERKRVLNVLAQRRYRERKRQTRKSAATQPANAEALIVSVADSGTPSTRIKTPGLASASSASVEAQAQVDAFGDTTTSFCVGDFPLDLDLDLSSTWQGVSLDPTPSSPGGGPALLTYGSLEPEPTMEPGLMSNSLTYPMPPTTIDPTSLGFSPSSSSSTSPSGSYSSPSETALSQDSYLLPINELSLLKAWTRISTRLGVTGTVWELTAQSPFTSPGSQDKLHSHLPESWRPTQLQRKVAHHPVVDFIPWPSTRDKILQLIHLPTNMKPKVARGPMAIVFLAYDLEDSSEGLRISGDDPYDTQAWEVGQVVFEKWWFIFDRDIINQSNQLRKARGASVLRMDV